MHLLARQKRGALAAQGRRGAVSGGFDTGSFTAVAGTRLLSAMANETTLVGTSGAGLDGIAGAGAGAGAGGVTSGTLAAGEAACAWGLAFVPTHDGCCAETEAGVADVAAFTV